MIRHSGLLAILIALFSILLALPYINAYRSGLQITPELQESESYLQIMASLSSYCYITFNLIVASLLSCSETKARQKKCPNKSLS